VAWQQDPLQQCPLSPLAVVQAFPSWVVSALHVPLLPQLWHVGQLAAVHTQVPPEQLGVVPEQAWHVPPPLPQAPVVVPAWQVPLLSQQPLGQLLLLHTHLPPEQVWPDAHAVQAPPPLPQAEVEVPAWQVPLLQQPVQQVPLLLQQPVQHEPGKVVPGRVPMGHGVCLLGLAPGPHV
jgi:hypothetical protein